MLAGMQGLRLLGTLLQRTAAAALRPLVLGLHVFVSALWHPVRERVFATVTARSTRLRVAAVYLSAVACSALFVAMTEIDAALRQMHFPGATEGGARGFPLRFDGAEALAEIEARRDAWAAFAAQVQSVTRTVHPPTEIVDTLLNLDRVFVGAYAVLLTVLVVVAHAANQASATGRLTDMRRRMLLTAAAGLAVLVVVDLYENARLERALIEGDPTAVVTQGVPVGPLLTAAKLALVGLVLLPLLTAGLTLVLGRPAVRDAVRAARAPLLAVALLTLVLARGIGAEQVDDVVRAWAAAQAVAAAAVGAVTGLLVGSTVRHLTDQAMEHPDPDAGDDPQPLLLGGGLAVAVAGVAGYALGGGWGLIVPGALLLVIWALGVPLSIRIRTAGAIPGPAARAVAVAGLAVTVAAGLLLGARAGVVLVAALAAATWAYGWRLSRRRGVPAAVVADSAEPPVELRAVVRLAARGDVAAAGDGLGALVGAWLTAMGAIVVARATAFDAYVRAGPGVDLWPPVAAASALGLAGLVLALLRTSGRPGPDRPLARHALVRHAWLWTTGVLAMAAVLVLVVEDWWISVPSAVGSLAVVYAGVALLVGISTVAMTLARHPAVGRFRLAPALRVLGLRRFPGLVFLLVWVLVVSLLDPGGFHDIRRSPVPAAGPPPTLEAVRRQFAAAQGPGPRPVVLVAAQGGGIRAAVWAALVMECLFGPGPVETGAPCAVPPSQRDPLEVAAEHADEPVPVFLASGASGGSVGLAAWAARRTDLITAAPGTPATVEAGLGADFLAPNIARLFLADVTHAFLAHEWADRAEVMERAWEAPWGAGAGLARGLRETWQQANGDGGWRIPVLALNGVTVEDGCRFLASPVDFALAPVRATSPVPPDGSADRPGDATCRGPLPYDGDAPLVDVLSSTSELVDYLCPDEDVPLSTAAHLSARFPYISPTGRVERRACDLPDAGLVSEGAVSFDADGGAFDNSGAATALDAWRALASWAAAREQDGSCLVPVFVQIDNSPGPSTSAAAVDRRPPELLAPLRALAGEISSRESYARSSAAAAFIRPLSAGGSRVEFATGDAPEQLWFRIVLFGQPGPEPPLGWTLSRSTVDDMRAQLGARPNVEALEAIRDLLDRPLRCRPNPRD